MSKKTSKPIFIEELQVRNIISRNNKTEPEFRNNTFGMKSWCEEEKIPDINALSFNDPDGTTSGVVKVNIQKKLTQSVDKSLYLENVSGSIRNVISHDWSTYEYILYDDLFNIIPFDISLWFVDDVKGVISFTLNKLYPCIYLSYYGYIGLTGCSNASASGANLGAGQGIFAGIVGNTFEFKSLTSGGPISLSSTADEIKINSSAENNTISSVGGGTFNLSSGKVGVDLQVKTATAGTAVNITDVANVLTFSTTAENNTISSVGGGTFDLSSGKVGVDLQVKTATAGTAVNITDVANVLTFSTTAENNTLGTLGAGNSIVGTKVGTVLNTKSFVAGTNIVLTSTADEIKIDASGVGGESNTLGTLGAGESIAGTKVGTVLNTKSLVAGTRITLTTTATEIEIKSTGGPAVFDNTLTVANPINGADYVSIKAAVDFAQTQTPTATSTWGIQVYPGNYAEDPMIINSFINISSVIPCTVFITPTDNTVALIDLRNMTSIIGLNISGINNVGTTPSAILINTASEVVVRNCRFIDNYTCIRIDHISAAITIESSYIKRATTNIVNGIYVTNGVCFISDMLIYDSAGTKGNITNGINCIGNTAEISSHTCIINDCTIGVHGQLGSLINLKSSDITNCSTGIQNEQKADLDTQAEINVNDVACINCDLDVDMTASPSMVMGFVYLSGSIIDILHSNLCNMNTTGSFFSKNDTEQGLRILGTTSIGHKNSEGSVYIGQGMPYTKNISVVKETSLAVQTEITSNIISTTSTALFPGGLQNEIVYFGTDIPFAGVQYTVGTAINLGANSLKWEYYSSGSAGWEEFTDHATNSQLSFSVMEIDQPIPNAKRYGPVPFKAIADRIFLFSDMNSDWGKTIIAAKNYYWIRVTVIGGNLTANPLLSNLRLVGNSIVFSSSGNLHRYGLSEFVTTLSVTKKGFDEVVGAQLANNSINISSDLPARFIGKDNRMKDNNDILGGTFKLPIFVDTSVPLLWKMSYYVQDGIGSAELTFSCIILTENTVLGQVYANYDPSEFVVEIPINSTLNTLKTITGYVDISNATGINDYMVITISTNIPGNAITVVMIETSMEAHRWKT